MIVTIEIENEIPTTVLGNDEIIEIECEWEYEAQIEECHGFPVNLSSNYLISAKIDGECILSKLENEIPNSKGEEKQFLKEVNEKIFDSINNI